jgi:hypothetical protein
LLSLPPPIQRQPKTVGIVKIAARNQLVKHWIGLVKIEMSLWRLVESVYEDWGNQFNCEDWNQLVKIEISLWKLEWASEDGDHFGKIGMRSLWGLKEMNWRSLQWTCEDWHQFVNMEIILWRWGWACEDWNQFVKIGISLWGLKWACEDGDELVKIGMSFANVGINLWRLKRACEDCGMRLLYLDKVVHGGCGTKWRSHHHERLWQCSSIAAAPFNLMCMILW